MQQINGNNACDHWPLIFLCTIVCERGKCVGIRTILCIMCCIWRTMKCIIDAHIYLILSLVFHTHMLSNLSYTLHLLIVPNTISIKHSIKMRIFNFKHCVFPSRATFLIFLLEQNINRPELRVVVARCSLSSPLRRHNRRHTRDITNKCICIRRRLVCEQHWWILRLF